MARAKYGPGAQVCSVCNRKVAFYRGHLFTDMSPEVTLLRCNKCAGLTFGGETVKAGPGSPVDWAVAAKAIRSQISRDETTAHAAQRRAADLRQLLADNGIKE